MFLLLLLLLLHLFGELRIKNNKTAKVIFFEDGTGVITNGTTLRVQFDYNFTEGSKEGEKTRVKTLSFSVATDLLLVVHTLIKLKRNVNSQKRRRYIYDLFRIFCKR